MVFRQIVMAAIIATAATLSPNEPVKANTSGTQPNANRSQSLPTTITGGAILEETTPSQLSTEVRANIVETTARTLRLPASLFQIAAVQRILWDDGCMGISPASSNFVCTTTNVPGWRALLTSGERQWRYQSTDLYDLPPSESARKQSIAQIIEISSRSSNPLSPPVSLDCSEREFSVACRNVPGFSQFNPILPTRRENNWFIFNNVRSQRWVDPVTEYGFQYQMMGDSRFTHILDFPVGIDRDNLFQVSAGDRVLGQFQVGQEVDFLSLLGTGVPEFTISGIQGAIDPNSPVAFPARLAFDTETASFKMRAISRPESIPEPQGALSLLGLGLLGVGMRCNRAVKKRV